MLWYIAVHCRSTDKVMHSYCKFASPICYYKKRQSVTPWEALLVLLMAVKLAVLWESEMELMMEVKLAREWELLIEVMMEVMLATLWWDVETEVT